MHWEMTKQFRNTKKVLKTKTKSQCGKLDRVASWHGSTANSKIVTRHSIDDRFISLRIIK